MKSHTSVKNPLNDEIYININGALFKRNEAKISVFDSGFLLGDGVWEGFRLHHSKLLFIDAHLRRIQPLGSLFRVPYGGTPTE